MSVSIKLGYPLPNAQEGDSRLLDIQAVKTALVSIDDTVGELVTDFQNLSNVDNTADIDKPVSTLQSAAIAAEATARSTADSLLTTELALKSNIGHVHSISEVTRLQGALDNLQSSRRAIIANAGDSISYLSSVGCGSSFLMQALGRKYNCSVLYGEPLECVYQGTITFAASGNTVTMTYDPANATTALFVSKLQNKKWIKFPTSGVPSDYIGQYGRITSFNTATNTVVLNSNSLARQATINGGTLATGTFTNVQLNLTETVDRYVLAQGGWTSTEILTQIQYIQDWVVVPDILIVNGGTNDGNYASVVSNLTAVCNSALAAGVKVVVLLPMSPKVNNQMTYNNPGTQQFLSAVRGIENYAEKTPGVYLLNQGAAMSDPTALTWTSPQAYGPIGGLTNTRICVTSDGLHPSVRGGEVSANLFVPLLQKIARKRSPRATIPGDIWDSVTPNYGGNFLGRPGLFYSSGVLASAGKLNNVANAGIADGLTVNTYNTGYTVTPSRVVSDYIAGGYTAQRFAFSGTTDASGSSIRIEIPSVKQYSNVPYLNATYIDAECCLKVNITDMSGNGVVTSASMAVSVTGAVGGPPTSGVQFGPAYYAGNLGDTVTSSTDWIFMTLPRPFKVNSLLTQSTMYIVVNALPNTTITGYIEIAHCGMFLS